MVQVSYQVSLVNFLELLKVGFLILGLFYCHIIFIVFLVLAEKTLPVLWVDGNALTFDVVVR